MAKNNIDPQMIEKLKNTLENGDMLKNMSKIAEMLAEPNQAQAVKNLLTNKALEKVQEQKEVAKNMSNVDPRLNLLLALKPFLTEYKAQKVDKMAKAISLSTLFKDLKNLV